MFTALRHQWRHSPPACLMHLQNAIKLYRSSSNISICFVCCIRVLNWTACFTLSVVELILDIFWGPYVIPPAGRQ